MERKQPANLGAMAESSFSILNVLVDSFLWHTSEIYS